MMDKRGKFNTFMVVTFVVLMLLLIGIIAIGGGFDDFTGDVRSLLPSVEGESFGDRISSSIGFEDAFDQNGLVFFNYIFGEIPEYLVVLTGGSSGQAYSAGIVIIGLWVLLLLSFADIARLFSTFNAATSWAAAVVLAIIAANINFVKLIAVFMLTITAGLGAFSVFAGLILAFILFLGIQFGSDRLRRFAHRKKLSEMEMRAAMGSESAKQGLKVLKGIGKEAAHK